MVKTGLTTSPILFTGDTRYAYSTGRVRSLELRLVPAPAYAKLIATPIGDFARMLTEYGYNFPQRIESPEEINAFFQQEKEALLSLIEKLFIEPIYPQLFRKRFDFLNTATIVKERIGVQYPEPAHTISFGLTEPSLIRKAIDEERFDYLPPEIASTIKDCFIAYKEEPLPYIIDTLAERAYYILLFSSLPANKFIRGYYSLLFDLMNITNFIRFRLMKKSFRDFLQVYIPHGRVDVSLFKELCELSPESVPGRLLALGWQKELVDAVQYALHESSFTLLESVKLRYLTEYLALAIYCPFGPEVVFSYYQRKLFEIEHLQTIALASFYSVSEGKLKKELDFV